MLRALFASLVLAASAAPAAAADSAATLADLQKRVAALRLTIERAKGYDGVENLFSVYGYYVDKSLYDQYADLWAREGTMEMAQRGVYVGLDSVRRFHAGDREGPAENRLLDHPVLGPVIHVAPDGRTARVRARMLQMMGQAGGRGTWGMGIYENEAVKEDGVWKIKSLHTFNTFVAGYDTGPVGSSPSMPGPSATVPPDRPATVVFEGFPKVYDIPVHYRNPVTGR